MVSISMHQIRINCLFSLLILCHVKFHFVNGSAIGKRSLADDIRNGINLAGKIFGFDTTASNVADLVARAFSNHNNINYGVNNKNSISHPLEHLENFDEHADNVESHDPAQHGSTSTVNDSIDDNVIVGSSINTSTGTDVDTGFFSNILRVLGMDNSKIGALAINGLIFIAQMIGRSFLSTFGGPANVATNDGIVSSTASRRFSTDGEQPRSIKLDSAFDWILDKQSSNPYLSQQLTAMQDNNLPERLTQSIDDENNTTAGSNTDCIKLLLCKSAQFVWGMQKAVSTQLNERSTDGTTPNEKSDEGKETVSADENDRLNEFFRFLPDVAEFKNHGDACEARYSGCKIF